MEQTAIHEDITLDSSEDTKATIIEEPAHKEYTEPEEPLSVESNPTFANEHPPIQESIEIAPVTEEPSSFPPKTSLKTVSPKRPNFIRRLLGKIWGS
jgi:hypothetical protein